MYPACMNANYISVEHVFDALLSCIFTDANASFSAEYMP
jgi:hypothetical protein